MLHQSAVAPVRSQLLLYCRAEDGWGADRPIAARHNLPAYSGALHSQRFLFFFPAGFVATAGRDGRKQRRTTGPKQSDLRLFTFCLPVQGRSAKLRMKHE